MTEKTGKSFHQIEISEGVSAVCVCKAIKSIHTCQGVLAMLLAVLPKYVLL